MEPPDPVIAARFPEIAISAVWHEQRFVGSLRTTDGRPVEVIHRGNWTHGFGPDFQDAMVLIDGRELLSGSIEIHLSTGQWRAHGHHLDERYNSVILHLVLTDDGSETRRADGALVPTVCLPVDVQTLQPSGTAQLRWSQVGGDVCAETLSRDRPHEIRTILGHLGDIRLASKSARLEARLTDLPPGDVLYHELFDGLGFSANREPMRSVAARVPLADLELLLGAVSAASRIDLARGLLFGVAGFLPISPSDAALARLSPDEVNRAERFWQEYGTAWQGATLSPTAWTRARVRPANHPALRLSAGAAVIANASGGLVASLLAPLQSGTDSIQTIRHLATWNGESGLGIDRAASIVINALIPFALALAEHTGDRDLSERTAAAWETLPAAEANEVTRRALRQVAGASRLSKITSRAQQGLIHLDATLCSPRRCYECPIARRVVAEAATVELGSS